MTKMETYIVFEYVTYSSLFVVAAPRAIDLCSVLSSQTSHYTVSYILETSINLFPIPECTDCASSFMEYQKICSSTRLD